jgi:eukaryotic-like serine/threonine-protein kinase
VALVEELKPGSDDATNSFDGESALGTGAPPERLGDFRSLREIGRGGMGVVYHAEQESLGRSVALKVLSSTTLLDRQMLRRFHREARAAANLHRTNIVPVYGVGEENGCTTTSCSSSPD